MPPRVITTNVEDNDFQRVKVLSRNRTKRHQYREFFVEGVALLDRALEGGWHFRYLVYSTERRLSDWAMAFIESASADLHLVLPLQLMAKLSEKKQASELIAVAPMPDDDLSRIRVHSRLQIVVVDRPSNHGNLGTIIRSCDALRADGVVLTGHSVDLYDPRTLRASVGSLFAVPCVRLPSHRELLPWIAALKAQLDRLQVVGTSAKSALDVQKLDLTRPTMWVIGNETTGLSSAYRGLCDAIVQIPIYGSATSLNAACATSILLYEADRQRR